MKNNRASGILKLIAALRSMAKSKSLALKSKTNAIKARLVIFSLVMNKRYVMSTISDKFQSLLGHHHSHLKEVEDGNDSVEDKCTVVINDNAHLHEDFVSTSSLQASIGSSIVSTSERCEIFGHTRKAVSNVNPSETQMVVEDNDGADDDDGCECFYTYGDDDDDDDDGEDEDDMIPPHEWIARKLARSQISSFSVCEGIGRTLKGRDLSKVRNAILTKTGFIE